MQLVGFRKNDITNTLAFRFTDGVETTPTEYEVVVGRKWGMVRCKLIKYVEGQEIEMVGDLEIS